MSSNLDTPLTDTQTNLLQEAVHSGYFKVPREISLVELAEMEGVSDVEASEALRRGIDNLVRDTLPAPSEAAHDAWQPES